MNRSITENGAYIKTFFHERGKYHKQTVCLLHNNMSALTPRHASASTHQIPHPHMHSSPHPCMHLPPSTSNPTPTYASTSTHCTPHQQHSMKQWTIVSQFLHHLKKLLQVYLLWDYMHMHSHKPWMLGLQKVF